MKTVLWILIYSAVVTYCGLSFHNWASERAEAHNNRTEQYLLQGGK